MFFREFVYYKASHVYRICSVIAHTNVQVISECIWLIWMLFQTIWVEEAETNACHKCFRNMHLFFLSPLYIFECINTFDILAIKTAILWMNWNVCFLCLFLDMMDNWAAKWSCYVHKKLTYLLLHQMDALGCLMCSEAESTCGPNFSFSLFVFYTWNNKVFKSTCKYIEMWAFVFCKKYRLMKTSLCKLFYEWSRGHLEVW